MALNFSCNQYEKEFQAKRLQNWEVAKKYRSSPKSLEGFTQIIATDRGHLMGGVPRSQQSPWGTFVGTWDLPLQIPGNKQVNPTARSSYAHQTLLMDKTEKDYIIQGKQKDHAKTPSPRPMEQVPLKDGCQTQRSGAHNPSPKDAASPAARKSTSPPGFALNAEGPMTPEPPTPPAVAKSPAASPMPVRPKSGTPIASPPPGNAEPVALVS